MLRPLRYLLVVVTWPIANIIDRRARIGRVQIYIEPRDIWMGVYVAPNAVYVCPLPLVVIRWDRKIAEHAPCWECGHHINDHTGWRCVGDDCDCALYRAGDPEFGTAVPIPPGVPRDRGD